MAFKKFEMGNFNQIADAVIDEILKRKDPFEKITLVFHSMTIAQWFKAYFLKNNKDVLMNVDFTTLSSFVNDALNQGGKYRVLTAPEYRDYIVKALLDEAGKPDYDSNSEMGKAFAFFNTPGGVNPVNLYEFADKLATVLINMEFDKEEIPPKDKDGKVVQWQKDVYEAANTLAAKDGAYTPRSIFDKFKNMIKPIKGKVHVLDNSYISALYGKILAEIANQADITVYSLDSAERMFDKSELYAAPSVMREVEWLHTEICKTIETSDARVSDFLVYAPNINDYANAIERVFRRTEAGFPELPYCIVGNMTEKYDMVNALSLLYEIANRGFFTRYDLFRFVQNPMVMRVWGIDTADIDAFKDAIEKTNTHRGGYENAADSDWIYLKERLLTSLLADGVVNLGVNNDCLPYTSIDMESSDRINKLIEVIEALEGWSGLFEGKDLFTLHWNKDEIAVVAAKLNALFSKENKYGEEKNYYYDAVKEEMGKIAGLLENGGTLPVITILRMLQAAVNCYSSAPTGTFAKGVTFMSLDVDNVVPDKYVYVLGMSSAAFPRVENRNELDHSTCHKRTHKLDADAVRNLFKNAETALTFSYVNCDLKTEEEYYPCALIYPSKISKKFDPISLDESRDLDKLYTNRELLNRHRVAEMYGKFIANKTDDKTKDGQEQTKGTGKTSNDDKQNNNPIITTSQIKRYLENTIVYKYKQLIHSDSDEDAIREGEYDPIDVEGLEKYKFITGMIRSKVEGSTMTLGDMNLERKLPRNLEQAYYDNYNNNDTVNEVVGILSQKYNNGTEIKEYKKVNLAPVTMTSWTLETNTLCYVAQGKYDFDNKKLDGSDDTWLSFIEPRERKDGAKYYLTPYVCALAYVADKPKSDLTEYCIQLITSNFVEFKMTPAKACDTLNAIYAAMTDYQSIRYMDVEFIDAIFNEMLGIMTEKGDCHLSTIDKDVVKTMGKIPSTLDQLVKLIGSGDFDRGHDSWSYFHDKKMLDPKKNFGYANPDDIKEPAFSEFKKMLPMVLYLWQNVKEA